MKTSEQLIAEAKSRIQEQSVETLHQVLKNDHHTILIDVREPEEFAAGHVDRAVNLPRGVLEMKINQHPLVSHHCDALSALQELAEHTIYVMCGTGGRSALAADTLQNMGFGHIISVMGGFQAWLAAGYPVDIEKALN